MKRTLMWLLTIICLMIPFSALAADNLSPTIDLLWWSEPSLNFQLIKNQDELFEYLELISTYYDLDGFNEMVLGTDNYEFVDMIIVSLDKAYQHVVWHTPSAYTPKDNISVFMIATDLRLGYVMNANGDKNGNLNVNYSEIAPGEYFMIIYAAD